MGAIYLATYTEDCTPICAASTLARLFDMTDNWFGATESFNYKSNRLSWIPYNGPTLDSLVGNLIYDDDGTKISVDVWYVEYDKK